MTDVISKSSSLMLSWHLCSDMPLNQAYYLRSVYTSACGSYSWLLPVHSTLSGTGLQLSSAC